MNLNIEKAFKYPIQDPKWITKLIIGAIISVIPIVHFAQFGYLLKCIKDVSQSHDDVLPEWDDLLGYFVKGFMVFLILFIYSLPFLLIGGIFAGSLIASGVMLDTAGKSASQMLPFVMAMPVFMWLLIIIYGAVIMVITPSIMMQYAIKENFKAAFNFKEHFTFIKDNLSNYIVFLLLEFLAFTLAQIGVILFCIGIMLTIFYAWLFSAHLMGQMASAFNREE